MVTITVNYGYDVHSIEIDEHRYEAFKSGETVAADGQGFMYDEEGWQQDHWVFDGTTGQVSFLLDNGAEFFGEVISVDC